MVEPSRYSSKSQAPQYYTIDVTGKKIVTTKDKNVRSTIVKIVNAILKNGATAVEKISYVDRKYIQTAYENRFQNWQYTPQFIQNILRWFTQIDEKKLQQVLFSTPVNTESNTKSNTKIKEPPPEFEPPFFEQNPHEYLDDEPPSISTAPDSAPDSDLQGPSETPSLEE